MNQQVHISAAPYPFKQARVDYYAPEGMKLSEMLALHNIDPRIGEPRVFIDGELIPINMWHRIKPKASALVVVKVVPLGGGGGGKSPLKTILSIAVLAAGAYLAAAFAVPLAASFAGIIGPPTLGQVAFASALIKGAVGIAGSLLINAIAPPPKPKLNSQVANQPSVKDSPTLFIEGARNNLRPFAPVPVGLGHHRFVPPLGAKNFTESAGDKQYVRQVFNWGYGPYDLDHLNATLKIGETLLSEFEDVEYETVYTEGAAPTLTLYPNSVDQTDLSVNLTAAASWQTRTTVDDVDEILVDVTFPQGLVRFNDQGNKTNYTVLIEAEYSPTGAGTWSSLGSKTFTRATTAAIRETFRASVPNGTYDVRVRRVTADTDNSQVFDEVYWTALRTVTMQSPIQEPNVVVTAIRMRATDQLNGVVDTLSGELKRVAPDWSISLPGMDGSPIPGMGGSSIPGMAGAWTERVTSNPAALFRWVLQGPAIHEPLDDSRLDLDTLQEWSEFCEDNGFEFNAVIDYESTIRDILGDIASAGRASPTLIDGKWSVVIDKAQTEPVANFTPRNSWGYQGERVYPDVAHAFRCQFLNEDKDWRQDERIVYDDGYNAGNATKYETIEFFGITSSDQIYKHGREHIASVRLRPEIHSFWVDVENLVATRGDLITLTHDVPLFGVASGRVKSVTLSGPNATHVVLDSECSMESGKFYSIRFRLADGSNLVKTVVTVVGDQTTLQFTTPFTASGAMEAGDLFMFGESGQETVELVIQAIEAGPDFTAKLRCVDAAPAIFDASTGTIPDFNSNITAPIEFSRPNPPVIANIQTGEEVMVRQIDGSVATRMVITLTNNNAGDVAPVIKIRSESESDYRSADVVYSDPEKIVLENLDDNVRYDLKIWYKRLGSSFGSALSTTVTRNNVLFEGASARPNDVTGFRLTVVNGAALLSWNHVTNIDFSHYEIRFSPELSGVVWGGAQILLEEETGNRVITPLQLGTYLIKAVDRSGLYSQNEALVVTTIASIDGLNAVELLEEDPGFDGYKDNCTIDTGQLVLDDISLGTGTYKFADWVDLGASYTSKVTPNVVARGKNEGNILDVWGPLVTVTSLSGTVTPEDWGISIQYRTTLKDPSYTHPSANLIAEPYDLSDTWTEDQVAVTVDDANSPRGDLTADTITEDSDTGEEHQALYTGLTVSSSTQYTASIYLKRGAGTRDVELQIVGDVSGALADIAIDLDDGSIISSTGTASVTDQYNGWYRAIVTFTTGASDTELDFAVVMRDGSGTTYNGDGSSSILAWGFEVVADDEAYDPEWTAWDSLIIGDYTFWAIEFQAILTSQTLQITPGISRLEILIDMPDRIYAENDLVVTVAGRTITYVPPFKAKPKVVITAQELATGDYWEITNQSTDGFDVVFKDSGGSPVERTFDYIASGYGRKQL